MTLNAALVRQATSELQGMVDAVRDDAPSFEAILLELFGREKPTLGAIRRGVEDVKVAALVRRPFEEVTGRNLRAVPDLAEAIGEVLSGYAQAEPKAIQQSLDVSTALANRVLEAAR